MPNTIIGENRAKVVKLNDLIKILMGAVLTARVRTDTLDLKKKYFGRCKSFGIQFILGLMANYFITQRKLISILALSSSMLGTNVFADPPSQKATAVIEACVQAHGTTNHEAIKACLKTYHQNVRKCAQAGGSANQCKSNALAQITRSKNSN